MKQQAKAASWTAMFVAVTVGGALAAGEGVPDKGLTNKLEVIKAGTEHEECFRLEQGDSVDYSFESTRAVYFNIHYHDANRVVEPVKLPNALYGSNTYNATVAQDYCMMWENQGKVDAKLQYGFRLSGKSVDTLR